MNCVIAVCPADITVTVGIEVPGTVMELAVNVRIPEGLVSDAAYKACTPPGKPFSETSAVSLVDSIWIGTVTGDPPGITNTVETGRLTVIGACDKMPPLPPQLKANSAQTPSANSELALRSMEIWP